MRRTLCVAAAMIIVAAAPFATAGGHDEALLKELTALGDMLTEAMLTDDVDTMLGMYAEDAISLPNYGPRMQGIEAFKKHHEMMAASGMKITSFESEPTEAWGCGNQVIEIGTFKIALDMPGMPGIQDEGKYMTVYVREADGSLKIKAETWNTDMNPMEMAGSGHSHGDH